MSRKHRNDKEFDYQSNNQHQADNAEQFSQGDTYEGVDGDELLDTQRVDPATLSPLFEHGEKYHQAGKRDVELYIRTYNTLLHSSGSINLKALIQAHYNIDSSLHPDARKPNPDMSAFIYSVLRLPDSINHCALVLLGQSEEIFQRQGYQVDQWQAVTSSARRRKWFYDGKETLAA